MNLFLAALLVSVLNIPFGYWRAKVEKFSWQWFVAIHVPIPFVVLIRFGFNLGFQLYTYPVMIVAFFGGQFFGKKLNNIFNKKIITGKNIIKDIFLYLKEN